MKARIISCVIALLSLIGAGCHNMPAIVRALAKDPATVSVNISTIYGQFRLVRIGGCTNETTTSVSPDGSVMIKRP